MTEIIWKWKHLVWSCRLEKNWIQTNRWMNSFGIHVCDDYVLQFYSHFGVRRFHYHSSCKIFNLKDKKIFWIQSINGNRIEPSDQQSHVAHFPTEWQRVPFLRPVWFWSNRPVKQHFVQLIVTKSCERKLHFGRKKKIPQPFDVVVTADGSSAIVAKTFFTGSPALAMRSLPGGFKILSNFVWKLFAICNNSVKPSWCRRKIKTEKLISINCSTDLYLVVNSGDALLA